MSQILPAPQISPNCQIAYQRTSNFTQMSNKRVQETALMNITWAKDVSAEKYTSKEIVTAQESPKDNPSAFIFLSLSLELISCLFCDSINLYAMRACIMKHLSVSVGFQITNLFPLTWLSGYERYMRLGSCVSKSYRFKSHQHTCVWVSGKHHLLLPSPHSGWHLVEQDLTAWLIQSCCISVIQVHYQQGWRDRIWGSCNAKHCTKMPLFSR